MPSTRPAPKPVLAWRTRRCPPGKSTWGRPATRLARAGGPHRSLPPGDRALAVVMDYKSGSRKLDPILIEHGVQLQLLAYLAALRRWPTTFLGAGQIVPAGVFYVNLRGQFEGGATRAEVLAEAEAGRRLAYRHAGRFDAGWLDHLDQARARINSIMG